LVGQTADNGNCETGCAFFFAAGWIDNGEPTPLSLSVATIAWFDNSPPLSPNYPQAPIGRALFSTTRSDSGSASRGPWLVQAPEPIAALGSTPALAATALASRRRRQRTQNVDGPGR
jgi:hypothetical protein